MPSTCVCAVPLFDQKLLLLVSGLESPRKSLLLLDLVQCRTAQQRGREAKPKPTTRGAECARAGLAARELCSGSCKGRQQVPSGLELGPKKQKKKSWCLQCTLQRCHFHLAQSCVTFGFVNHVKELMCL